MTVSFIVRIRFRTLLFRAAFSFGISGLLILDLSQFPRLKFIPEPKKSPRISLFPGSPKNTFPYAVDLQLICHFSSPFDSVLTRKSICRTRRNSSFLSRPGAFLPQASPGRFLLAVLPGEDAVFASAARYILKNQSQVFIASSL